MVDKYHFIIESIFCAENAVFTTLHRMQTLSSDEISVRLSNAWIVTKREERSVQFLYHTKDNLA